MRQITKTLYCDVAVIGGGAGGCAAAIESARNGMHTVLLEKGVTLGGLATNGYVPQVAGSVEGICEEFCSRLFELGELKKSPMADRDYYHNPAFEPEYGKIVLEDMLFESGARIVYDSTFVEAKSENGKITEAVFFTKGGFISVKADIFIDATGDADVAASAGVPFEVGGQDFAGLNLATTQGSRWSNADLVRYQQAEDEWKESQQAKGIKRPLPLVYVLEEEAIQRGEIARHVCNRMGGFFRVLIPNTPLENADFVTFSFHSYYTHNTDAQDITRQILEQHQLMKQFHTFLKNHVPGFEKVRLIGMGSLPGCRDSRRIFGEYMLKSSDVACGIKFDDGIARFPNMFDSHHPTSERWFFIRHIHIPEPAGSAVCEEEHLGKNCSASMHPFGVPAGIPARPNPRDYCEIPYRCLVPKKIDNLLCVGRCSSVEFHANGAIRIIAPAMGTGQAAGLAASIAVKEQLTPRQIDGVRIRQLLIDKGIPLDKPCGGHWEELRNQEGRFVINGVDAVAIMNKGKIIR